MADAVLGPPYQHEGVHAPPGAITIPEDAIDAALERMGSAGSRSRTRIIHAANPFQSLAPTRIISVETAGGGTHRLFLKLLDPSVVGHPEKDVRDREVRVYRDLLDDPVLPVPRYLASWADAQTGANVLLLEWVDGWDLRYQAMDRWYRAAAELARIHVAMGSKVGSPAADALLVLDAGFFESWRDRAVAVVRRAFPELEQRLPFIVARSHIAGELLAAAPPTLVHNDLAPKNVMVTHDGTRVAIIDWEMAGVGCGDLDLMHLTYGLDTECVKKMTAAYLSAIAGTPLSEPTPGHARTRLAAAGLHRTLYRLAWAEEWRLPIDRVRTWIDEAESYAAALDATRMVAA